VKLPGPALKALAGGKALASLGISLVRLPLKVFEGREGREWRTVVITVVAVFAAMAALGGYGAVSAGAVYNFLIGLALTMCIFSLLGLGLQLQFGHAGILNLGLIAFAGLAAYGMGIVWRHAGVGLAASIQANAGLQAAVLGCIAITAAAFSTPIAGLLVQRLRPRASTRFKRVAVVAAAVAAGAIAVLLFLPLDQNRSRDAVMLLGMLVGIGAAVGLAFLFAIPAIRLREDYLAIVTLGAAELLESFYRNEIWLTGGTEGILNLHNPISERALSNGAWQGFVDALDPNLKAVGLAQLLVAALLLFYFYVLFEALIRSPWGRVLRAIREDDAVAGALGKNVNRFRLQALVLGSMAVAVAGILIALRTSTIFPGTYERALTFSTWVALVVGGVSNNKGVVAGAAIVLVALPELARNLRALESLGIQNIVGPGQGLAAGLMLILVMMYRPHGLVGRKEELLFGR